MQSNQLLLNTAGILNLRHLLLWGAAEAGESRIWGGLDNFMSVTNI